MKASQLLKRKWLPNKKGENVNFQKSIQVCYSKFSTFSGRASRSEYWWFYLYSTVWGYLLDISDELEKWNAFGDFKILVYLVLLVGYFIITVPLISAGSRRLHDIGKSGWWQLLYITIIGTIPLIIWMARPGSREYNKYGPAIENI
jgi:uncharacterized membrane protein YhaH (DUF805 family)